ncbi:MAG: hypothetical protein M0Q02_13320, partial [Candidatus Muirbacterium halophilum]|nr:hypothetical protein [Candidatus Muirbacterium halophilum]
NHSSIFSRRILNINKSSNTNSLQKLSSGLRINRAGDDAAGLAVSEKMRGQISGLDQAHTNVQDAISMVQSAEGVLEVANSIIVRMRQLAIQSANDNYTNRDRIEIQRELDQLVDQIDRVANYTEFNNKVLLNGDTIGLGLSSNKKIGTADIVGEVENADYMVTILDAGTASNVHGTANLTDVDDDGVINLGDAGVTGDAELHIKIDKQTRVIVVDEKDSLQDVVRKINDANVGVLAGLDSDQNDITLTSVHSGSRFNISFGADPDGVAVKLGLYGGQVLSDTKTITTVTSNGVSHRAFTSGTDTIISIANVTHQPMFPTMPGRIDEAGGVFQSMGIFRSDSDIFTEKELSRPIGGILGGPQPPALGNPLLENTRLLKGIVLRIDEQLDYGYMQRTEDDDLEHDFTRNFPVDPAGVGYPDHRAQVPGEREVTANNEQEWKSITQFQLRIRSNKQNFHVGANEAQVFLASFGNITPENLGLAVKLSTDGKVNYGKTDYSTGTRNAGPLYQMNISIQTRESAEQAITIIDDALKKISLQRTSLGSMQNALEKTGDYILHNRLYESESRIRDVDMAKEMLNFTKTDLLNQSGVTMLSHANSKHETILQLLK